MKDPLFGDLEYWYGWRGQCAWTILGEVVQTPLIVSGEEEEEIEPAQRDAFVAFERHKLELGPLADQAILDYYREILPECRERFGDFADEWAPEIDGLDGLKKLITPTGIFIKRSFVDPPKRVVGMLFDCSWDTSLGLAVKFVNERLVEVGPQDIVL